MNDLVLIKTKDESCQDSRHAEQQLNDRNVMGARERTTVADLQFIPLYRELRDRVKLLARRSESCVCGSHERSFHLDIARAIDAVMGLAGGRTGSLSGEQRFLLGNLQAEFRETLRHSLDSGDRHRLAVEKARRAALDFLERAGRPLSMEAVAA